MFSNKKPFLVTAVYYIDLRYLDYFISAKFNCLSKLMEDCLS